MAKYEYTTTPSMGTDLNEMGAGGWDMCSSNNSSIFWKRELPETDTIHHKIYETLQQMAGNMTASSGRVEPPVQRSDAERNAATHTEGKPGSVSQPADRPVGKTEAAPRPESTARTEETAKAGAGGTAEAAPRGHTPPKSGGSDASR